MPINVANVKIQLLPAILKISIFREGRILMVVLKANPLQEFESQSRIWFRNILNENDLACFEEASNLGARPGARLDSTIALQDLFNHDSSLAFHVNNLIPDTYPVRVISFNKTTKSNWGGPWHQDRVIAVREKHNVQGFFNWSKKSGVWHCEPPTEILEQMLFVQVYLDATDESNGAMEIALGSHRQGPITAESSREIAPSFKSEICRANRGDVLILKMLTLHRSLPSQNNCQRRTFRIDYAGDILPKPRSFA